MVKLCITSADPSIVMRDLSDRGVILEEITTEGYFDLFASVESSHLPIIRQYCHQKNITMRIIRHSVIYNAIKQLPKRAVIITGVILLLFLSVFIPKRVLFFEIEGNQSISDDMMIGQLEQLGIGFGCKKSNIHTTQLADSLIKNIPTIHWVGIQMRGCVMTIEIQENIDSAPQKTLYGTVSHLVANTDGIIEEITVLQGNGLCSPGQAVIEGQVLISGFEDHGFYLRATQARGEVYAKTYHVLRCVTPVKNAKRQDCIDLDKKISLIIGKKQINFYNSSGISPASCVKMYSKKYMYLPGGFRLPIAIVTECTQYYEIASAKLPESAFSDLEKYCQRYILSRMIAGQILNRKVDEIMIDDIYTLSCHYICKEQIGKIKTEEILNGNS